MGIMDADHFSLFMTPLSVFHLPDMDDVNEELTARLLAEAELSRGVMRSNIGGWHSVPDLSRRPEPCYRALLQIVVDRVREVHDRVVEAAGLPPSPPFLYGVQGWAMVMRDGDYATLHDHADAHWSVVYYADAGDADPEMHPHSGLLAFVDSRRTGRSIVGLDLFPTTFTVRPHTGALVVFPGFLQHYVHCYRGERPRVSISCNVQLESAHRPG
ncbi:MAG TPA: putative 2OG-Fe(II) oxygenase [Polyangia bacterium]|nr:putative 2OG-Fe(II) oxygenase [Polyangia bacterium]